MSGVYPAVGQLLNLSPALDLKPENSQDRANPLGGVPPLRGRARRLTDYPRDLEGLTIQA